MKILTTTGRPGYFWVFSDDGTELGGYAQCDDGLYKAWLYREDCDDPDELEDYEDQLEAYEDWKYGLTEEQALRWVTNGCRCTDCGRAFQDDIGMELCPNCLADYEAEEEMWFEAECEQEGE